VDEAKQKLAEAKRMNHPAQSKKLTSEANELMLRASEIQKNYLAPVMKRARGDAAYGLGVEFALAKAVAGDDAAFSAAYSKANANVLAATPPTFIQG
jgi:hypothetical protein